jgi:MFS family permease
MKNVGAYSSLRRGLFFSSQLIRMTGSQILSLILPIFIRDSGFSIVELGVITAGFGISLMIFEPIWGILVDRIGAKTIYVITSLVAPIIIFSYTLVGDLTMFALLRFIQGAFACGSGVSSRTCARAAIAKGGRAFGLWATILSAAGLIGPVVGGYIAETSYQLAFYAAAIISTIAFLLSFSAPQSQRLSGASESGEPVGWTKEEKKTLVILTLMIVIPYFVMFGYRTYVPVFAKESPKFLLSTVEIGYVFTIYGVVGTIAPLVLGELSERVGKRNIIIVGMVFEALAFVLLPWVSGIVLISVTAMLLSFGNSATSPIMMALLTDKISTAKHGLALGVYGSGEDLGIWLGPLMIGYLYQTYSAEVSFHVTAAIMLVTISFSFFILKKAE